MRFLGELVGFLLVDVGPDLIALNIRARDVDHHAAHDLLALLANHNEQLQDRVAVQVRGALDGTD